MRFFYVQAVKKYIFLTAFTVFIITLIIQFIPTLFIHELSILGQVKSRLGYQTTFFADNTFLPIRFLCSLFYAFTGGVIGLLYFRIKKRKAGHTILISNALRRIAGFCYLLLIYVLLHTEMLAIKPIVLPRINALNFFPQHLAIQVRSFLIPKLEILPENPGTSAQYPNNPSTNNSNNSNNQNNNYNPPQGQSNPAQPQQPQPAAPRMATAQELFSALNSYRQKNGRSPLQWDNQLASYSRERANLYTRLGDTDGHAGFNTDTQNGLNYKFYFYGLGENSSYGSIGDAQYIIEQWYGTSAPHNDNQLNTSWTHVGIGVSGNATNFVFGGGKTDTFHQN
jgi:uncharacterized protein YkwD